MNLKKTMTQLSIHIVLHMSLFRDFSDYVVCAIRCKQTLDL